MLYKAKRQGLASFLALLIILLTLGCGKMGDPVPPEHLQPRLGKDSPKQSNDKQVDSTDVCGPEAEDACSKKGLGDIEVKLKDY